MESIMFRILNMQEFSKLEEEIELLEDDEERAIRENLLEKMMEIISEYDVHVREYTYRMMIQILEKRGIVFESVEQSSIVEKWDAQFDSLVSSEAKQSALYYSSMFRWHLFSFGLLDAIEGKAAQQAFEKMIKSDLYLFFDESKRAYHIQNANLLGAKDVVSLWESSSLSQADLYFFDPQNQWTYVQPHEENCGPYFFKK